jgi:hypothetical protein
MNKAFKNLTVGDKFTFVGDRTNTVRIVTRKGLVESGMAVIETRLVDGRFPERIVKPGLTSVKVWS